MRDSFIFYRSFYESILGLPEQDQTKILLAICNYSLNFKEPKLEGLSKSIWILIKPQLDANLKRFQNGCKPKQNRSKKEAKDKQTTSKVEANNNVNVNVNDSVNVSENVNDNDKLINDFKNSDSFFNQLKMKYRLEEKVFNNHLELFISMVEIEKYNLSSLRTYFNNWLNSQLKNAPVKTKSGLNMNNPIL